MFWRKKMSSNHSGLHSVRPCFISAILSELVKNRMDFIINSFWMNFHTVTPSKMILWSHNFPFYTFHQKNTQHDYFKKLYKKNYLTTRWHSHYTDVTNLTATPSMADNLPPFPSSLLISQLPLQLADPLPATLGAPGRLGQGFLLTHA